MDTYYKNTHTYTTYMHIFTNITRLICKGSCTFLDTHILAYSLIVIQAVTHKNKSLYTYIRIYREGKLSSIHAYVIVHTLGSWKHYEGNNNKS